MGCTVHRLEGEVLCTFACVYIYTHMCTFVFSSFNVDGIGSLL